MDPTRLTDGEIRDESRDLGLAMANNNYHHHLNQPWNFLTDPVLLKIFEYLAPIDIVNAGATCKHWNQVSHDELLWKHQFYKNFNISIEIGIKPGRTSWLEEFKRLVYHTPLVETEILKSHSAPVLFVTFSHDGRYFVTCSKDGYILVWNYSYPASIKYSYDMKQFNWKFTQYAEFNESDSLLLVSGGHFGKFDDTSGEIAIFSLDDEMALICRILNKPFDILGTFYSEEYVFSGQVKQLGNLICSSYIWIHKADPDITSEHKPLMSRLFRFINVSARTLIIATCKNDSCSLNLPAQSKTDCTMTNSANLDQSLKKKAISENCKYENKPRFLYHDEYQSVDSCAQRSSDFGKSIKAEYLSGSEVSSDNEDFDTDSDEDLFSQPEKYLIFATGSTTAVTPHQIGIKRVGRVTFPKKLDPGPSLAERIAEHKERAQRPPVSVEDINIDDFSKNFDSLDHLIELHGHIIGMKLSPDHRYLYVNCRAWPEGYVISNPLDPPPVAQEIDIHVIDLNTFKEVGIMLRAHRAFTPSDECFLIFLDVCDDYIASGSEDKHAYLWDRHYGISLAKFPHSDVVNSVAFNPKDPETFVTVSDDSTIKIWRSRAKATEYCMHKSEYPRAIKLPARDLLRDRRMKNVQVKI